MNITRSFQSAAVALAAVCLLPAIGCVTIDDPAYTGTPTTPPVSYGQPLTAVNGQGTVTILEGDRTVAVCRTASPNIEQTRWLSEQEQIVVKSRGNHGPATVQLFNSRTGQQLGTVMAYELAQGGPTWAAGMAD